MLATDVVPPLFLYQAEEKGTQPRHMVECDKPEATIKGTTLESKQLACKIQESGTHVVSPFPFPSFAE
jgi:hypothetical protein